MKIDEIPTPKKKLSPLKAIKFYCKRICSVDDQISWKKCTANRCALYHYRLGIGNRVKTTKTSSKEGSKVINLGNSNVLITSYKEDSHGNS